MCMQKYLERYCHRNVLYACVGSARAMRCGGRERKHDGILGTDRNAAGVVSDVLYVVMCSCHASQTGLSRH